MKARRLSRVVFLLLPCCWLVGACAPTIAPTPQDVAGDTGVDTSPARNGLSDLPDVIITGEEPPPGFEEATPFIRPEWDLWPGASIDDGADDVATTVEILSDGESGGGSPTSAVYFPPGLPEREDYCSTMPLTLESPHADPNILPVRWDLSSPLPGATTDRPLAGPYGDYPAALATYCGTWYEYDANDLTQDIDFPYDEYFANFPEPTLRRDPPTFGAGGWPGGFRLPADLSSIGFWSQVPWIPAFATGAELIIDVPHRSGDQETWHVHILHAEGGSSAIALATFSAERHATFESPASGHNDMSVSGVLWVRMSERNSRLHVETRMYFDDCQFDYYYRDAKGVEAFRHGRFTADFRFHEVYRWRR